MLLLLDIGLKDEGEGCGESSSRGADVGASLREALDDLDESDFRDGALSYRKGVAGIGDILPSMSVRFDADSCGLCEAEMFGLP